MAKAAPPTAPAKAPRLVRAKQLGFYGLMRRRPGDVFTLKDPARDYAPHWMEPAPPGTPEHTTACDEALKREHREIVRAAASGQVAGPDVGEDVI